MNMKARVDKTQLRNAVEFVAQIAGEYLLLDFQESQVRVVGFDGAWGVAFADVIEREGEDAQVVLSKRPLRKVLKSIRDGVVDIQVQTVIYYKRDGEDDRKVEKRQCLLHWDKVQALIDPVFVDIPAIPTGDNLSLVMFSGTEFAKMNRVLFAASDDFADLSLCHVLLKPLGEDMFSLVTTDGYRLARQVVRAGLVDVFGKVEGDWLIPVDAVAKVLPILAKEGTVVVNRYRVDKKTYTMIAAGKYMVYLPDYSGAFPKYEGIINTATSGEVWVTLRAARLDKALALAEKVDKQRRMAVLRITPDSVFVGIEDMDGVVIRIECTEVEVQAEGVEGDLVVAFDARYVREMLKALKVGQPASFWERARVYLQIVSPKQAMAFMPVDDKTYVYVLMPMYMDEEVWRGRLA